ncbi:MAG: acyl-CoA thioesterase, partial [Myxococcota bacterium]
MSSLGSFAAVTRPTLLEHRGHAAVTTFQVDASWFQGKGAYGGVLAAALLSSMGVVVDDPRRLPRGLHVHFCAPVPAGVHEVEVRLERAGALVCHTSARAFAKGEVIGVATATFGAARASALTFRAGPGPRVPALEDTPVLDTPAMPAFCQHFEYRPCLGHLPWSGSPEAWFGGWIRPRVPSPLDAGLVVGLLDAFPPAVLARADGPRPAA